MDSNKNEESSADQTGHLNKKCCVDCKTTKTPLWRSGPAGPKSLCNACGIRYRKKTNAIMGLNKGSMKRKHKSITKNHNGQSVDSRSKKGGNGVASEKDKRVSEDLRVRLRALGKEVMLLRRQSSASRRPRSDRKLGEVEQAAVLLMALSCGSVFA